MLTIDNCKISKIQVCDKKGDFFVYVLIHKHNIISGPYWSSILDLAEGCCASPTRDFPMLNLMQGLHLSPSPNFFKPKNV